MPAMQTAAAERVGYDRGILRCLHPSYQRQLNQLGTSWGATAFLLSVPVGYAAWLIEKNVLLSLGLVAFVAALVINLLRLIHSGGGTAPELLAPVDYRPSLIPAFILTTLALMLAQPAQLILKDSNAEQRVQEQREEVIAAHHASLVDSGNEESTETENTGSAGFGRAIARCEFILLRLRLLWQHPQRAVMLSSLYCLLALLPVYLQRSVFLKAVQAYEHARYRRASETINQRKQIALTQVEQSLRAYPSYQRMSQAKIFLSTPEKRA